VLIAGGTVSALGGSGANGDNVAIAPGGGGGGGLITVIAPSIQQLAGSLLYADPGNPGTGGNLSTAQLQIVSGAGGGGAWANGGDGASTNTADGSIILAASGGGQGFVLQMFEDPISAF
jgi:hypothetical protein